MTEFLYGIEYGTDITFEQIINLNAFSVDSMDKVNDSEGMMV